MRGAIWGLPEGFVPPYRPLDPKDNRAERERLRRHRMWQKFAERDRKLREEAAK